LNEQLAALDRDLGIGSTGSDVRTVHQYLRQYGYFPNEQLASRYPAWRPIVATPPAREDVFDERTADAIRQFQINNGILTTGGVDESTRRLFLTPRCGVPDGVDAADPADKFAHLGEKWENRIVNWYLANTNDVTLTEAKSAITSALSKWSAQTGLTFVEQSAPFFTNILITFGQTTLGGIGEAFAPPDGDMTIDVDPTWSVANPTPTGSHDLESLVLHELGHSLGLGHAPAPAVMQPSLSPATQRRTLNIDDNIGISTRYDVTTNLPGSAKDIGAGADGSVWIVGTTPTTGGFNIFKLSGSTWVPDSAGGGAVRIAVQPNGVPWVVNDAGEIFRRTTSSVSSGSWQIMPGWAKDIGAGGTATSPIIWIVGTSPVNGGFGIFRFNGSTWDQDNQNGGAVRIAVGPRKQSQLGMPPEPVVPWLLNSFGEVFRRTTNDAFSGVWEMITPSPGATARDIGIGSTHNAFVIGDIGFGIGTLSVWNEQVALGGLPPQAAIAQWVSAMLFASGGPNTAISIGPNGRPFVVQNNGTITVPTP
jgi:hypothetical protein